MKSYPDMNHDMENEFVSTAADFGVPDVALQVVETTVETKSRTLSFPNAAMALFSALWLRDTYGETEPTDGSSDSVN
jgi:hypothetical protein